jgi:hypothetical protein
LLVFADVSLVADGPLQMASSDGPS